MKRKIEIGNEMMVRKRRKQKANKPTSKPTTVKERRLLDSDKPTRRPKEEAKQIKAQNQASKWARIRKGETARR